MTDEHRDESQDESDENLDSELEDELHDESGDDSTESETSEDETNQSEDDESDDSSSQEETESETSEDETDDESDDSEDDQPDRTPQQIAKYERNRRKSTERENRKLQKQIRDAGLTPVTEVSRREAPRPGLADRFWSTVAKVDIMEIAQDDPTVHQRAKAIRHVLEVEMPALMKDPNGVHIANDIVKGRMVKVTPGTESRPIKRKTTPVQTRTPETSKGFKRLSDAEIAKLSPEGLTAYETRLHAHLAAGGK